VTQLWLVGFVAVAMWTVRAYFWPMAPCRACKGTKTNKGSTRKRFGKCRKCEGTGARWVVGSRQVHKAVRAVVAHRRKQKEKKQ
jgi:hypothetical protein